MQNQSGKDRAQEDEKEASAKRVKDLEPKGDPKAGKGTFSDITITKPVDTSSPGHP
jgi:hypothetical protein